MSWFTTNFIKYTSVDIAYNKNIKWRFKKK